MGVFHHRDSIGGLPKTHPTQIAPRPTKPSRELPRARKYTLREDCAGVKGVLAEEAHGGLVAYTAQPEDPHLRRSAAASHRRAASWVHRIPGRCGKSKLQNTSRSPRCVPKLGTPEHLWFVIGVWTAGHVASCLEPCHGRFSHLVAVDTCCLMRMLPPRYLDLCPH